jgi:hypothetical protein
MSKRRYIRIWDNYKINDVFVIKYNIETEIIIEQKSINCTTRIAHYDFFEKHIQIGKNVKYETLPTQIYKDDMTVLIEVASLDPDFLMEIARPQFEDYLRQTHDYNKTFQVFCIQMYDVQI